jgi:hypothetical protein
MHHSKQKILTWHDGLYLSADPFGFLVLVTRFVVGPATPVLSAGPSERV